MRPVTSVLRGLPGLPVRTPARRGLVAGVVAAGLTGSLLGAGGTGPARATSVQPATAPVAATAAAARAASGPTCQGLPATIVGTNKSERLRGTEGDDVIVAKGGKDRVFGLGGSDVICAGGGNDVVKGGPGRDWLRGGGGKDRLLGQAGKDRLWGEASRDVLVGGPDADFLDGGPGRDSLNGGPAKDGCRGEKRRACENKKKPNAKAVDLDAPDVEGASLLLSGVAPAASGVRVTGGVVPVTAIPDDLGRFDALVDLLPGRSTITATSLGSGRSAGVQVTRADLPASGTVTGTVVDAVSGAAVGGATVELDGSNATTLPDGSFEVAAPADGVSVVRVRAEGFLAGLARAGVKDGVGATGDVPLVRLAEGESVGPEGATLSGDGWELVVPPGALAEQVDIQVTPLPFTGTKDTAYGIPLVDVSPTGLQLAEPATLTVDNPVPGVPDSEVVVTGLDPDTLTERTHRGTIRDGRISVELTSFEGEEARVRPEDQEFDGWDFGPLNKWGGLESFCTPFDNQVVAGLAHAWLTDTLLPFIRVYIGSWNASLWSRYLNGGSTSVVRGLPLEPTYDFVTDSSQGITLGSEVNRVMKTRVQPNYIGEGDPRPLPEAESGAASYTLAELDPGETYTFEGVDHDLAPGFIVLNYEGTLTTAGNSAGGTGSFFVGDVETLDERELSGELVLEHDISGRGVVTRAELLTKGMEFRVLDAIDFCPGNPGTGQETNATVPLSRLESTEYGDSGATWAAAVPFEVEVDLVDADFDDYKALVKRAHDNDGDKDGWPDFQPYEGAEFELDNCVQEANPSQEDTDDDGLGDACDPYTCDDEVGDKLICELATFKSPFTKINASGALGGAGSTATIRLAPQVPACHEWPGRSNWSPTPCYKETDIFASGSCVYQDPKTKEFKEVACRSLYTETPEWSSPPISEEADTYRHNQPGPVARCGAASDFYTYIYGGDARHSKWSKVGPTSLECRLTWDAARPDKLPGKTFMQIYGTLRGPENPDDELHEGFTARVSTWVPVKGRIVKD